jgi:hypothetical protein
VDAALQRGDAVLLHRLRQRAAARPRAAHRFQRGPVSSRIRASARGRAPARDEQRESREAHHGHDNPSFDVLGDPVRRRILELLARGKRAWLERLRRFWDPALEALATEIARGKRKRAR